MARGHRALIVPGGGPFADAVRHADARLALADSAAHWMAILAMDQYAHLIASRLADAALVYDRAGIADALRGGRIPVIAPARWLQDADPLPHSWEVTSDSIAAWLADQVSATALVLIKPPGASATDVDPYLRTALPGHITLTLVTPSCAARST
jgi:aspartokinase-like uncharacterized kinase